MSLYPNPSEPWHTDVPGECSCHEAWRGRGLQDDQCEWHRLVDAVDELRAHGWTVEPPT